MDDVHDLIGIGIGPFNLSLAALLAKTPELRSRFFDRKAEFTWHSEIMFQDSTMQTSYLKDLVTPVDPTSPYSFMNYLVENHLFYPFVNTQRATIARREFELYCAWAAKKMAERVEFGTDVTGVRFQNDSFEVQTSRGCFKSKNICVATGLTKRIPACASRLLGPNVFHAKSPELGSMDLSGKRLLVVGGGQTGIEIFRNALLDKWGRARDIQLITRRKNLEPLDESAFANDFFTPNYAQTFFRLPAEKKATVVASQKLASDGNTPSYLFDLYRDLYRQKLVEQDPRGLNLLACRQLRAILPDGNAYRVEVQNCFLERNEVLSADVIVLCTGFESAIPKVLEPLFPRIKFDEQNRFCFDPAYSIKWDGPSKNRIYALNFSRHDHGIVDPQTSLMAWRSAVVVNDLAGRPIYQTKTKHRNFIEFEAHPSEAK